MLKSTETSLRGTKRQDITYVKAAPRRRPLELSLLLNEGLVFRQASLNLIALHPSTIQETIEQKTQQMQWRMIVSSDDDRRAETAQALSNLRRGSHSQEIVNSSKNLRASRWKSRFKYELTILLRGANTLVAARNSPSAIGGNLE